MNCANCPLGGRPCRGRPWHVDRLCQLLDPADPKHDPRYAEVVLRLDREHRLPSAARRAASLARALWDWGVSGFAMAGEELAARRLEICRGCEHFDAGRCRKCGCLLAAKVRMATEKCPIDRW